MAPSAFRIWLIRRSFEAVFPGDTAYGHVQLTISGSDTDAILGSYHSSSGQFFVADLPRQIALDDPEEHILKIGFVPESTGEIIDSLNTNSQLCRRSAADSRSAWHRQRSAGQLQRRYGQI